MDEQIMQGGGMQGQGEGQLVECPCCGGSGKTTPEMAEKCMEMMQPAEAPEQDDTAQQLAAAMGTKPMMRR